MSVIERGAPGLCLCTELPMIYFTHASFLNRRSKYGGPWLDHLCSACLGLPRFVSASQASRCDLYSLDVARLDSLCKVERGVEGTALCGAIMFEVIQCAKRRHPKLAPFRALYTGRVWHSFEGAGSPATTAGSRATRRWHLASAILCYRVLNSLWIRRARYAATRHCNKSVSR